MNRQIYCVCMDIESSIGNFRSILSECRYKISGIYYISLQNMTLFDDRKFVNFCRNYGVTVVQINFEIDHNLKRINIVDIVVPTNCEYYNGSLLI